MTSRLVCNSDLEIGEAVLQGILLEVSSFPKPGLVTPISNGSHRDMNLQTFMLSSAAIAPCFFLCAKQGFEHQSELPDLLGAIRTIGIRYESHLLAVTHGVNTQRGILFSASVLAAAAGYLSAQNVRMECETLSKTISNICQGICSRDFDWLKSEDGQSDKRKKTAGEQLYLRYGVTGIRGEAEKGFPSVLLHGLPALDVALKSGLGLRLACAHTLLALIANCEDTTVLWRGGMDALNELKIHASHVFECGGMLSQHGVREYDELSKFCLAKNVSPGGSADLLALTLAMHILIRGGILNEIV